MAKKPPTSVSQPTLTVNPSDMASAVLTPEEQYERAEAGLQEEPEADDPTIEQIEPLLQRLPSRERDLLYLYFIAGKRQAEIAAIFEITQAAVSYRIDRALSRLKFMLSVPVLDVDESIRDLSEFFDDLDVQILVHMWKTSCQTEVAKILCETQGKVRHRFFAAVRKLSTLKEEHPHMLKYYKLFSALSDKKFNMFRSVKLPQWENRGIDRCG